LLLPPQPPPPAPYFPTLVAIPPCVLQASSNNVPAQVFSPQPTNMPVVTTNGNSGYQASAPCGPAGGQPNRPPTAIVPGGQTTPAPSPAQPAGTPAATVAISGQNPVQITVHANQFLDFTHSVIINLDPSLQASSVSVSTGSATIQGNQVVWNGFTMNAGDDATATVSLVVTGGTTLMASGGPSIQSVTLDALDQSGHQVVQVNAGGGPPIGQLLTACVNASGQLVVACSGSGVLSTPQFTVSVTWDLVWSFNSCPDATGTLIVTVLNADGSQLDSRTFSQPPSSNSGTQRYTSSGTFSLAINSPCSWSVQALQD